MNHEHFREPILKTPFHGRTSAACMTNEWYQWKGYTAVSRYTDVELEYFAIRNSAALFDMTPITKYRIRGRDAMRYLNRLVTRDMTRVGVGRVAYVVWCNDAGQVLDDGTVFRLGEDDYRLCSQERHLDWLLASCLGFDVEVEEETHELAALALQGPTSCAVLKSIGLDGIEQLKPFALNWFPFAGSQLMVSRTGFTGDLGYELWIAPALAEQLWDALMSVADVHRVTPIGSHALDTARIEAGFLQAGVDFVPAAQAVRPGRSRSPFELDLGRHVDLAKAAFNGRRALMEERRRGSRYRLVRLNVEGNKPAHDAFIYDGRRKVIGSVTSALWSPTAKANVAIGSVQGGHGATNEHLWVEIHFKRELQWARTWARCTVVEGPFYDPPRRRATPALDY